ncbi:NAD(P)-dependent methylenetetrahydromethanopterin dehydrogenase [Hyphomicrobium sp.]|uniref:NAD(P)-dependent methylenetetrahydromethanopterin dehydrogenase n=1 Tax=Hyphomicrobium sp. TaxID=82 RepID=UPI002E2F0DBF|nr:NAD(P)-dependent methylenetetrahydromethanopterin dehydrogenase [Hyphomicrobium sp.]HEX2842047.1 NAD(P)-dependent methylenetetrahydromethanopterin dehydrogenase [Hyphomicrobium sp.]
MRLSEDVASGVGQLERAPSSEKTRRRTETKSPSVSPPKKKAKTPARAKAKSKEKAAGSLPILYMLSPQKFMSPFDCNMAVDSGYKVVLPYDNVAAGDVAALVQDAIFSRPPKASTGIFIGGKDITLALDMMNVARRAMVPPFEVSVFADPGGSFTTAAAMVACVERALNRNFSRSLKGLRVSVFGAMGVVGFSSAVIAANEGAHVRIVAHDAMEPLQASAEYAADHFNVSLEPVGGQTDALKSKLLRTSDVIFTAGPAGVNIISRKQLAQAPNLMVAADVNAVQPYGIEGMDLFMDGAPLPGCSTLGVGALAIGDVKYKTQAGLFRRMLSAKQPLDLDFRDAFVLAREIVSGTGRTKRGAKPAV